MFRRVLYSKRGPVQFEKTAVFVIEIYTLCTLLSMK